MSSCWLRRSAPLLAIGVLVLAACTRTPQDAAPSPPNQQTRPMPGPAQQTPAAKAPTTIRLCMETVVIQNGALHPERLTVTPNCAVLFSNRDDAIVQIQGHDFLLGAMEKDQSWAHTYKEPGVFQYFNTKNPDQRGTVMVQP